jgi:hypothetical protein
MKPDKTIKSILLSPSAPKEDLEIKDSERKRAEAFERIFA